MRKLMVLGLTVVFSSFFIQSCDLWEDETYHPTDPSGGGNEDYVEVIGTWKVTSLEFDEPFDINGDGEANKDLLIETGCYQNELMVFNEDFTGSIISNDYAAIEVNVEVGGNDEVSYAFECEEDSDESSIVWTQEENTVLITLEEEIFEATLSGDKLIFTIEEGFYISGADEEMLNITFTYTKQED